MRVGRRSDRGIARGQHLSVRQRAVRRPEPQAEGKRALPRTDLRPGPDVQTITYVGLKPGTYTYVCDLHPSMKGTLTVTTK